MVDTIWYARLAALICVTSRYAARSQERGT